MVVIIVKFSLEYSSSSCSFPVLLSWAEFAFLLYLHCKVSYDNFKLRKIRALYGKRVTMQINEIDSAEEEDDQGKASET